jgi:hypothetical protein
MGDSFINTKKIIFPLFHLKLTVSINERRGEFANFIFFSLFSSQIDELLVDSYASHK